MLIDFGTKDYRRVNMYWTLKVIHVAYLMLTMKKFTYIRSHKRKKYLTEEESTALHTLITKYELLLNGNLGTWKNKPADTELKTDAKPYHTKTYPVPRVYESVFKKEIKWI